MGLTAKMRIRMIAMTTTIGTTTTITRKAVGSSPFGEGDSHTPNGLSNENVATIWEFAL